MRERRSAVKVTVTYADDDQPVDSARVLLNFLSAGGDKVQLMILFRGREMAHQELGMKHCREVAQRLEDISCEEPARVSQVPPRRADLFNRLNAECFRGDRLTHGNAGLSYRAVIPQQGVS